MPLHLVDVQNRGILSLKEQESIANLVHPINEMREKVVTIGDRTIYHINSTAQGGGVSEMLPRIVYTANEVGLRSKWLTINTTEKDFFTLTKRIHNYIHGAGDENDFTDKDRELFEKVNEENAYSSGFLTEMIKEGDFIVIHDPQPAALIKFIRKKLDRRVYCIWRCHIGLDEHNFQTRCAWNFLKPYLIEFDHAIFTAKEYVPNYLQDRYSLLFPSIAPLSPKNEYMSPFTVFQTLVQCGLANFGHIAFHQEYKHKVERYLLDPLDLDLPFSPICTQVSRFDKLKGWLPLMKGFCEMKRNVSKYCRNCTTFQRNLLENVKLILAGPEPASISDDPEGLEVVQELKLFYSNLPRDLQRDIGILLLPMSDIDENARIVNALQRLSLIVFQNSFREGFGLTVTEAMLKRVPVIGSRHAVGIRLQIRDGIDGRLVNAQDDLEIAEVLAETLMDEKKRYYYGMNSEKRVLENFLVYSQIVKYSDIFQRLLS
ncbi:hypothetical protein ABK040_005717 [Willaertia magna]